MNLQIEPLFPGSTFEEEQSIYYRGLQAMLPTTREEFILKQFLLRNFYSRSPKNSDDLDWLRKTYLGMKKKWFLFRFWRLPMILSMRSNENLREIIQQGRSLTFKTRNSFIWISDKNTASIVTWWCIVEVIDHIMESFHLPVTDVVEKTNTRATWIF